MGKNTELVVRVEELRAVLKDELCRLFSQFGHDQGPAEYEIDYIIGGIVERGTLRQECHPRERTDNL